MGREVRRVPLDFDWPLNERWKGFLSPEWRPCPSPDCENGSTIAGVWVERFAGLILLLDSPKLHPWLSQLPLAPSRPPSRDVVAFCIGLAGREGILFGHDAIDRWHATKALCRAAGLPEGYFTCKTCGGTATHPDDQAASEAWQCTDPPEGPGWQLWETVSEGSPITPVFTTPEALARWLAAGNSEWEKNGTSYDEWLRFITGPGWAPSIVLGARGLETGVEAAVREKGK